MVVNILFGALGNFGHGCHSFHRVFAGSSFAGEHNGAGAVVNGVGHVGGFRTGGARVFHHAVQHLGGSNYIFGAVVHLFNNHFLNNGNVLKGDFNAHVPAGNHNAIGNADNFVNIGNALGVFYFCNNAYIAAVSLIQNFTDVQYILGSAHKGSSNKIEPSPNTKKDVLLVPLADVGDGKVYIGDIDALAVRNRAAVNNGTVDFTVFHRIHPQFNKAIVN